MGLTWVLSAPDEPHVGPMNLALRVILKRCKVLMHLCTPHTSLLPGQRADFFRLRHSKFQLYMQSIFQFGPTAFPDSKVHGANMGPIWGRQDQGEPHLGPMDFAIWVLNDTSITDTVPYPTTHVIIMLNVDIKWHDDMFFLLSGVF